MNFVSSMKDDLNFFKSKTTSMFIVTWKTTLNFVSSMKDDLICVLLRKDDLYFFQREDNLNFYSNGGRP